MMLTQVIMIRESSHPKAPLFRTVRVYTRNAMTSPPSANVEMMTPNTVGVMSSAAMAGGKKGNKQKLWEQANGNVWSGNMRRMMLKSTMKERRCNQTKSPRLHKTKVRLPNAKSHGARVLCYRYQQGGGQILVSRYDCPGKAAMSLSGRSGRKS